MKELPDYADKIKHPMDFSTMRSKIERHAYRTPDEFIADFELIISNCTSYNARHTMYHKAAIRLRHQTAEILLNARETVLQAAFCPSTGMVTMTTEPQNGTAGRKRSFIGDHSKFGSLPVHHEDRRSSDRVKMPTRRYLIDDEITPALPNVSQKRKSSTDSEEPPVLSRCPSPVDGASPLLPPIPRKRPRLGSSHKDPPFLVKSAPCLQSHDPSNSKLDDSLKTISTVDSIGITLLEINETENSGDKSENVDSNLQGSERLPFATPQAHSQNSKTEISDRGSTEIDEKDRSGQSRSETIRTEMTGEVSVALESDGSDSLSGNSFPPGSYLKSLESMKVDSAYSSASCSSSD